MNSIGVIITIILVVAWVVKGLSEVMGNEEKEEKGKGRSLEEWDAIQAKRREAATQRRRGSFEVRADASSQNPAQMTMAERIELARQRARQQAGVQDQGDQQEQARQRARAQAEERARQQREQSAQRERAQRERAAQEQRAKRERELIQQQRRRQAQQRADQEAQAKHRRRSKQQHRTKQSQQSRAADVSKRENAIAESMRRIHEDHGHGGPTVTKLASPAQAIGAAPAIGKLDRNALRKAFIMKEILDKPVAMRDPQADLPS